MNTLILLLALLQAESPRPLPPRPNLAIGSSASGTLGAVSAGGAEAVEAGMTLLRNGGNAADAAAATLLALSVTDAHLFCLGGEVPILVFNAQRQTTEVLAGQGAAPSLATPAHLAPNGSIPTRGLLPAAVPAAPDAILTLLERHGTRRFADVVAPTLDLLDRHALPWHAQLAQTLRALVQAESSTPDRILGLRRAADYFYRGPIADQIDAWSRAQGGLLRRHDLATHLTRIEEPIALDYHGHTILKCGPWTQGPALLQALLILQNDPLDDSDPAADIHLIIEALKLALADRDSFYADPLFAKVPLSTLLDPNYARQRRALIDPNHASTELRPAQPLQPGQLDHAHDTTTCLVADRWGNVVAATPSGWSGTLAGQTGLWLGTRLQSFRVEPDHPNSIQPGKRPRITLSPTLVLRDGQPVLAISVAGGDLQDQVTLQLLIDLINRRRDPITAVAAPRVSTAHHIGSFAQSPPRLASLTLDDRIPPSIAEALQALGHQIDRSRNPIGAPSILVRDPRSGRLTAAGDPRAGRHAAAD
ncbi:MAG: gamma-glutamyltranspeptidase [Isosphaeraceae bacterium]|jgi:gamma-glutamyltranspeptidase/glutathione hydrolase|nr:MAG: gamma-glutamyltranspeptidase [Isosphaeraceae bacterium]